MGLWNATSSIGLYIGTQRIHMAELTHKFGQLQKVEFFEIPYPETPPGSFLESLVMPAVEAALQKIDVQSKSVTIALSGKEIIFRYFEMPLLSPSERRSAAYFESHKYSPLNIRELYYNFEIIPDKRQKKMDVLFVASKKNLVQTLTALLNQKGAKNFAWEPCVVSLMRCFYHGKPKGQDGEDVLVDLHEDGSANIAMVRNRTLLWAQDCAIPESGNSPGEPDFESFVTDLRLAFNYFSKNFGGETLRQLMLFSDPKGRFRNWDKKLAAELGVRVEPGSFDKKIGAEGVLPPSAAIAAGLALRDISPRSMNKLNLIPPHVHRQEVAAPAAANPKEKAALQQYALGAGAAVVALVFIVHLLLTFQIASKKGHLNLLKNSRLNPVSVTNPAATVDELKQVDEELQTKLRSLELLTGNRIYWTTKMNEIARLLPDPLELTQIDYSDEEDEQGLDQIILMLNGRVLMQKQGNEIPLINNLVSELKKNKEFMGGLTDIKINSLKKESLSEAFSMSFSLACMTSGRNP